MKNARTMLYYCRQFEVPVMLAASPHLVRRERWAAAGPSSGRRRIFLRTGAQLPDDGLDYVLNRKEKSVNTGAGASGKSSPGDQF